jgi:NAD(P)-dependent dehydrogenase (short-subunit alcohol dehydrogenase family)
MAMGSSPKPIAFITGANRGIGFELARTLARDHNFYVLLGSRSPNDGAEAAKRLQSEHLCVSCITIDVSSDDSITRAATTVAKEYGHIDVLVNNAGVMLDTSLGDEPNAKRKAFHDSFNTNVAGAALVTDAFTPMLSKASVPRILFVTSTLGSITNRLDTTSWLDFVDHIPYRASKAALNMLAAQYANRYKKNGFKVNVVCPGFVKTRMVGFQGNLTTDEAMPQLVKMCTLGKEGETGTFTDEKATIPW